MSRQRKSWTARMVSMGGTKTEAGWRVAIGTVVVDPESAGKRAVDVHLTVTEAQWLAAKLTQYVEQLGGKS